jgi:hypothetical protein
MADSKSSIGIRIIMNIPNELNEKLEDYRILKRKKLNTAVPKTSEGVTDLMILGLLKLEELLAENSDTNISNDSFFVQKVEELSKFREN